ncbi:metallo-beta-lactamase class B [Dysgonomonas alginatilytica]|uniref:beta-lactamase n=1 Tax=Dysgonomonas alginatilytica TaxID=1605892 RepID=A0A2V3PM32_9BACT|nr:subclass B1 metallo-beta-lactamase [Dysgonomonas alginatilytica]PXV63047.1 metallo-beta-lactamase class B [Dysgonomonas alginatilytica]
MKARILKVIVILQFLVLPILGQNKPDTIRISDDIDLIKLSDNAYLHISYLQTKSWGKVGANGLLLVKNGEALMIDTPWNDEQTEELTSWIKDSLHATITAIIPTHWHEDCMGGLRYLQSEDVKSYAGQRTINIAKEKNLPVPQYGFTDSLSINFQNIPVECYYFGGGHTIDLIEVWLPTEDILFAGDVLKDIKSKSLGNIADADIKAWPITVKRIAKRFPKAKTVIPGHGNIGGADLIEHTLKLLEE